MDLLLTTILIWLSVNYNLPATVEPPSIEIIPAAEIAELRYGEGAAQSGREVFAVYIDAAHTIYLPAGWQGRTPGEVSILVHETVHHLQNLGGEVFACPAERERLAFAAQEAWLGLFGKDLASEFDYDPTMLKFLTQCLPH